jgi:dienelactone hydrolase
LFLHWGQGDRGHFVSEALLLAQAGVVSLMIDAPHRRAGAARYDEFEQPERERDEYVQLVVDLRRGLDILLAHPGLDPQRIGYVGHSLGATWGGALAGVERRIQAYVLIGGLPRITDFGPDTAYGQQIRSFYSAEQIARYTAVLDPIQPVRWVGGAAPAVVLFQFASLDRFIPRRLADEYGAAASAPKKVIWYETSHEFTEPRALADRLDFLSLHLGLRSLRPDLIDRLGKQPQ